ncbi:AAA family ATPase [Aggregatilineales bacterium SYSU G02658]
MLTRIETLNYRALRHIRQDLQPFQVLIGPNASGKSSFIDIVGFIADIITRPSLLEAVRLRVPDFRDLTWMKSSTWFELAIEAQIPHDIAKDYRYLRYEIRLGEDGGKLALQEETLWMRSAQALRPQPPIIPPERITFEPNRRTPAGWRKVVSKTASGNDYFKSETTDWNNLFRLGPQRPALANIPEDSERFPVSAWFRRYLMEGVQRIMLNSEALRRPSPPQSPTNFLPDGSNLPWVIHHLEEAYPDQLDRWVRHVQTALADITAIRTVERPEDRHRYLVIEYQSGLSAPSWVVSDGTLRMLALTILAFLPEQQSIYLIEEPENGIHPRAIESVFQALTTIYNSQVFIATHSPVILSMADPKELLCFSRASNSEVVITAGNDHERLADWHGEISLGTLFAAGVL